MVIEFGVRNLQRMYLRILDWWFKCPRISFRAAEKNISEQLNSYIFGVYSLRSTRWETIRSSAELFSLTKTKKNKIPAQDYLLQDEACFVYTGMISNTQNDMTANMWK